MATNKEFVDFVLDQIEDAGEITAKKMFGEYGLFSNKKIFALICDNKLFIKPTEAGRAFINNVVEAPAYPGAKLSFLIEDKLEDREWISHLVRITLEELPEPKLKKKKKTIRAILLLAEFAKPANRRNSNGRFNKKSEKSSIEIAEFNSPEKAVYREAERADSKSCATSRASTLRCHFGGLRQTTF